MLESRGRVAPEHAGLRPGRAPDGVHPDAFHCTYPGFEVDLYVTANTMVLTEVYLGRRDLRQAIRDGLVQVEGPRDLARAFPDWIGASHFTRYGRPSDRPVRKGR